ncbi:MAG: DUF2207 domain-containing protein [Clostridia bacterium]|nr:DUF2207 domain-containing protein [Clostridia bacterium]
MLKKFNLKIIALFAVILLCLLTAFTVSGASFSSTAEAGVDDNYHFKKVDVNIAVNKDKTFNVTETMTVNFEKSGVNRGIIRDIQRLSKTTRIVGGKEIAGERYFATLTDVYATFNGEKADFFQEYYGDANDFYSVYIRQPDGRYITAGDYELKLTYTYGMADDKVAGFDDFTFDVLGYAMAKTDEFCARIEFPEGTDLSNVTFRTNEKKPWTPAKNESTSIEDNVITIKAYPSKKGKGYTVQVILPDGYFNVQKTFYWYYILIVVFALAGVAGMLVAFFMGRNRKPLQTVEFYPPEDCSVMKFSSVWHVGAKAKDTGALILKWAGKGAITIKQDGRRHVILKADVLANKKVNGFEASNRLKIPKEELFDNLLEERYFNTLFSGIGGLNFTFSTREFKKRKQRTARQRLYDDTEALTELGDKKPEVKKPVMAYVVAVTLLSVVPTACYQIYLTCLNLTAVPLVFLIFMTLGNIPMFFFKEVRLFVLLIFPLVFYGAPYAVNHMMYGVPTYDYIGLFYICPVVWFVGVFILPLFIKKRTEKAQATYGKILGFRRFILTAELPKIQMLFDENPFYFADILPYCLIMGISDKVQKRFSALSFSVPDYVSEGVRLNVVSSSISHSNNMGRPSGVGFGGGGGGGSSGGGGGGGSSGGGGGGGGSRGC